LAARANRISGGKPLAFVDKVVERDGLSLVAAIIAE
jgi:hypothetical protein